MAEFVVDEAAPAHRPPVVEIDFHRAPHSDPAGDGETFAQDALPSARLCSDQCLAYSEAYGQAGEADSKADATLLHQGPKFKVGELSAMGEVVVDRLLNHGLRIRGGPVLEMDP